MSIIYIHQARIFKFFLKFYKTKTPDYILILAWNFASSIIKNNKDFKEKGGKFIIPLPNVEIV